MSLYVLCWPHYGYTHPAGGHTLCLLVRSALLCYHVWSYTYLCINLYGLSWVFLRSWIRCSGAAPLPNNYGVNYTHMLICSVIMFFCSCQITMYARCILDACLHLCQNCYLPFPCWFGEATGSFSAVCAATIFKDILVCCICYHGIYTWRKHLVFLPFVFHYYYFRNPCSPPISCRWLISDQFFVFATHCV